MAEQIFYIRKMRCEDVPAVTALDRSVFSEPWTEAGFFSALAQEGNVFLVATSAAAERENGVSEKVIGYCGLYVSADEGDITNVAVASQHRRGGVAAALIEEVKAAAGQRGVKQIFLEVRESNRAAQNLYLGAGFEFCGRRKSFYRKPTEDALLMTCRLPGA
ncbi:MAG: ribosomal protein S18-alanine N-acetyltransferase [Clostridiales bacterium]|nr:ribosomal protein S18-alanine N-acetyltransferase [Clostridiales bacterium]